MSGIEKEPLTSVVVKHVTATSGNTMITRAPWPNGQYYRLRKIECASMDPVTVSGILWKFWDEDLSSTTTVARGSGAAPLLIIGPSPVFNSGALNVSVSGQMVNTVTKSFYELPRQAYYAGVTVLTNQNSTINLELEIV